MRKFYSIAIVILLLATTMFAGKNEANDSYEYDYNYTLDYDTLVVVEEVIVDSVWDDGYILCDTVVDDVIVEITKEDTRPVSQMGESSASLYAGKQFKILNQDGAEFEFCVNDDGVTATLLQGHAHGAEKLVIPSSVTALDAYFFITDIADFAFKTFGLKNNGPMAGVKFLDISEGIIGIGQNCFEGAPDLIEVSIPVSLKKLSCSMFYGCPNLKNIIVPEESNIREIDSFAFADCTSLNSSYIPKSVVVIGKGPWRGCKSLEKLTLSESNYEFVEQDGVLYTDWQGHLIQYPAGKKDKEYHPLFGTKAIANSAFYGNPYLEKVNIPTSLDSISHRAFYDCASLNDVAFNGKITFIGNKAFAQCPQLKYITLYGNPHYTIDGGIYDTFDINTNVAITTIVQQVNLIKSKSGILASVWDYVAQMPYFYNEEIKNNEDVGFPDYLGIGKAAVCGNAEPKPDVLHVLEVIPSSYMIFENVDNRNRITRFYIDKTNKKNPRVLYFFGGIGGNDLVVAFFENGNLK